MSGKEQALTSFEEAQHVDWTSANSEDSAGLRDDEDVHVDAAVEERSPTMESDERSKDKVVPD